MAALRVSCRCADCQVQGCECEVCQEAARLYQCGVERAKEQAARVEAMRRTGTDGGVR